MEFSDRSKKKILIASAFLVCAIAGTALYSSNENPQVNETKDAILKTFSAEVIEPLAIEDEPMPFEELTIPYLRNREYNSQLGPLQRLSNNSSYTSYLTSYDSDSLKINGLLTVPTGDAPEDGWPAVIFIHGYIPPTVYRTTENYSAYVDYLARNGFVVFKIDLRGHNQSEGEASGAYYSSDYIIDALNAYSALQNADFVDANSIGMWGHSMAGNVVIRSVAVKQDIPAVVIWAGAVYTYEDFQKYSIEDNSYRPPSQDSPSRRRRNELFETHGAFDSNSEFWKLVPATNFLEGVTTAVQINHAVNDDVVDIGYSRDFISILDNTNIPHELVEHSSGGHNISGASYNSAMQNTVRWFKENL